MSEKFDLQGERRSGFLLHCIDVTNNLTRKRYFAHKVSKNKTNLASQLARIKTSKQIIFAYKKYVLANESNPFSAFNIYLIFHA